MELSVVTAGEVLEAGDLIYINQRKAYICRFFIGEDLTPTEEPNNRCRKDGGNCNDPTKPCMCHYQDDNY